MSGLDEQHSAARKWYRRRHPRTVTRARSDAFAFGVRRALAEHPLSGTREYRKATRSAAGANHIRAGLADALEYIQTLQAGECRRAGCARPRWMVNGKPGPEHCFDHQMERDAALQGMFWPGGCRGGGY